MTCREFTEFLDDYLAGELPEAQRHDFERHLHGCRDCAHYLDSYRHTIELGKAAFADECADRNAPVPAQVPEALVRAVLDARSRKPGA